MYTPELNTTESNVIEMTKRKEARSVQISMPLYNKRLLELLATISGSTMSEIVQTLLEPYLYDFMVTVLKEKGLCDDYGKFLLEFDKIKEIIDKDKRNPQYAELMKEFTDRTDNDFPFYSPRNI